MSAGVHDNNMVEEEEVVGVVLAVHHSQVRSGRGSKVSLEIEDLAEQTRCACYQFHKNAERIVCCAGFDSTRGWVRVILITSL